jgi:hypothetical protein|tara:strand:+ start:3428 stop:3652 length:225 start_codon:yes stop_codon:yes gene_type:complete
MCKNVSSLTDEEFRLNQNYPNPFNPTTKIRYDLPNSDFVNIDIYDIKVFKVKSFINTNQGTGQRVVTWDASQRV